MKRYHLKDSWETGGTMHSGRVPDWWAEVNMPEFHEWLVEAGITDYTFSATRTGDWNYDGLCEYRIWVSYESDTSTVAHRMRW